MVKNLTAISKTNKCVYDTPAKKHSCEIFLISNLAAPRPTLGYCKEVDPMLINVSYLILPESHREPRNEVGCGNPARPGALVRFQPGTFSVNALNLRIVSSNDHHLITTTRL